MKIRLRSFLSVLLALPLMVLASTDEDLILGLEALQDGDLLKAESVLAPLAITRPPNRLARLLLADIAAIRGGSSPLLANVSGGRAEGLLAEARARLKAAPWRSAWEQSIYRIPESMTALLWVDTQRARSYWLRREAGGLQLVRSFYTSIGSNGAGKQRAWDRRTPIGLYFAVDRLEGFEIHEQYGAMAFPLNYPNGWDREQGRTGDGIWLHGVEASDFARPPRDSDGCVVLTNQDLKALAPAIQTGEFAVIVSNAERPAAAQPPAAVAAAETVLEAWRVAFAAGDADGLRGLYEPTALESESAKSWLATMDASAGQSTVALSDLFLASYPGEDNLLLARFQLTIGTAGRTRVLRRSLFLRQHESGWAIAAHDYG